MGKDVKPGIIVLFFGFLGIILAYIEQYLSENSYVLDEYLAGTITLADLQIVTIVFAIIVGILVAVVTS